MAVVSNNRNTSIDVIKVIAMFMAVVLHFGVQRRLCGAIKYSDAPVVYSLAGIAIPLFFMVSGYLMINKDVTLGYSVKKIFRIVLFFFVAFVYYVKPYIGGIEYFFGFPLCWIYALLVFLTCISIKIKSKIVGELSNLFLPVYTIHNFVICHVCHRFDFVGVVSPVIDYLIVVSITVGMSYLIMKIPIAKEVFKI